MKVMVWQARYIEVKKSAKERIEKAESEGLCCACMKPFDGTRIVRGCHERCARATYRAIERGEFTDADRVADGKWLDAATAGRKPSNPVTIEARG